MLPSFRRLCAVTLSVALASFARAGLAVEGQGGDYYAAPASPPMMTTLRNVETHHIEPGLKRVKERNYSAALADFEFILNYFPNHPKVLMLVTELCDVQWITPQCNADTYFERAIAINPNASPTYILQGLRHQRRKELDKAIAAYTRSLELNPTSANAHYNIGLAYFDLKRFDLANLHGQASYALGYPFPGLREKLTSAGRWKALPDEELKKLTTAVAPDAVKRN